jgi:hypothetical protein
LQNRTILPPPKDPAHDVAHTDIFDGENTVSFQYGSDGHPIIASFVRGDGVGITTTSPLAYAGLNILSYDSAPKELHKLIEQNRCTLAGKVSMDGRNVYEFRSPPLEVEFLEKMVLSRHIYCDPSAGFLPARIEFIDGRTNSRVFEFEVQEFRQVRDISRGTSRPFPSKCVWRQFIEPGLLFRTIETDLVSAEINGEVDPETFRFRIAEGTPVLDGVTHQAFKFQTVKTTDELASEMAEAAKQELADALVAASQRPQQSAAPHSRDLYFSIALSGVCVLILVCAIWWRHRAG